MKTNNAKRFSRAGGLVAVAVFGGNILAHSQTLTTIHSFTAKMATVSSPTPSIWHSTALAYFGNEIADGLAPSITPLIVALNAARGSDFRTITLSV